MELVSASVDWMEAWDTPPSLVLTVDALPERDALRWRRSAVNPRCFYAEDDGYASFLFGDPLKPGDGFCGQAFDLTMAHGSAARLIGPYSGSAGAVNATEYGPVVDAIIVVPVDGRPTRYAGACTLGFARRAADSIGVPLAEWVSPDRPDEVTWVPVGGPVRRCPVCLVRLRSGACTSESHNADDHGLGWKWPEPVA